MLAHAVLVWCGVRATGLTTGQQTTGQVKDKCRTSTGQVQDNYVQDNYRTTTRHCPTVKPALRTRLRTLSCPPPLVQADHSLYLGALDLMIIGLEVHPENDTWCKNICGHICKTYHKNVDQSSTCKHSQQHKQPTTQQTTHTTHKHHAIMCIIIKCSYSYS